MTVEAALATQVYQLYIKATPERVWEAITTPDLHAKFFHGAHVQSTYEVGTPIRSVSPDGMQVWADNVILQCDPPRLLVHSWRSLYDPELAAEPESRVSWEIEPMEGGYCKLTVIHDRLDASPKTAKGVSGGWMFILCGLKTLVETGEPLGPAPR